jgi:hypothetical protein
MSRTGIDVNQYIKHNNDLKIHAKEMYFSDQALGALMMALQKSLLEQSDITPVLKGFKFRLSESGLVVMNPPLVKLNEDFEENEEE